MTDFPSKLISWFLRQYYMKQPNIILDSKILAGKIRRFFIRPPFPITTDGSRNLHLGCGTINHPMFINVDAIPASHVHYVRSIDNLSPFKDYTVDLIYACHCLEHFSHNKLSAVLSEWYRVLRRKGILRLSVPDFDLLLVIYEETGKDVNSIMSPLMGSQDNKYDFHKAFFNKSSLTSLLKNLGFREVQEWQPGSSELTTFDDWSARMIKLNGKEYQVSLNIEAIK